MKEFLKALPDLDIADLNPEPDWGEASDKLEVGDGQPPPSSSSCLAAGETLTDGAAWPR